MYGIATGNITVRVGPGVSFAQYKHNGVGLYVVTGNKLESPDQQNGFWKLSKLTQVDGTVLTFPTDPAGGAGAWCGAAYIQETDPPGPSLPDDVFTLVISKPRYISQTVTVTLKPE